MPPPPPPPSPPPFPSTPSVSELIYAYRLTRTLWTASYVVLIYDYFLTLDDEIIFMWPGGFTRARCLYMLNRYWPLINLIPSIITLNLEHPTIKICNFSYAWFTFSNTVTQFTTTTILILRLYAMYGSSKRMLISLFSLQVVVFVAQGILSSFMSSKHTKLIPISHATGCLPGHWTLQPWAYGIPAITLDGCLFILVTAKSISHAIRQEAHTPELFMVLLRDSVIYFGAVFTILVANVVMWAVGGQTMFAALPQTLIVFHSIIGCRMLLNIRRAVQPWHAEPWRDESTAVFSAVIRPVRFLRSTAHYFLSTSQAEPRDFP